MPILDLNPLTTGILQLTAAVAGSLAEAASVCLEERGHTETVPFAVTGTPGSYVLTRLVVTETMRVSHNDPDDATADGACAIAVLLMLQRTGLPVVRRSRKGTGYDYSLGTTEPLDISARLEVSGIRQGERCQVNTRLKQKREQTRQSDPTQGDVPAYAVVVEFGTPQAAIDERK